MSCSFICRTGALKSDSAPPRGSAWKPAMQGERRDALVSPAQSRRAVGEAGRRPRKPWVEGCLHLNRQGTENWNTLITAGMRHTGDTHVGRTYAVCKCRKRICSNHGHMRLPTSPRGTVNWTALTQRYACDTHSTSSASRRTSSNQSLWQNNNARIATPTLYNICLRLRAANCELPSPTMDRRRDARVRSQCMTTYMLQ